ncbi:MAG: M56 and DUF3738 domain-containing protein [Acidobacteriota bacterium]
MLAVLVESSIRATLLIAAVALVLWLMRIRTASVRHSVWAGVVITMLLLPATVAWGPKALLHWLPAGPERAVTTMNAPAVTLPAGPTVAQEPVQLAEQSSSTRWTWQSYLVGLYLAGLAVFLLRLSIGTVQVNRLMRAAILRDGKRTHQSCATPITVGFFKPMVILPVKWPQWPDAQLNAVLAHEHAHLGRRDPLFQWLGLLNRAIFWFHPLAWWLDRQLSGLAEEACDDVVLSQGYDPQEYSQYLVSIARSLQDNGTRVEMIGMAMPGAALPQRIRRMLMSAYVPPISRPKQVSIAITCALLGLLFSTGTLARAQPPKPVNKFEVASVKASAPGGRIFNLTTQGDQFIATNMNLAGLLRFAFDAEAFQISSGPSWMSSDRFDIDAKGAFPLSKQQAREMLQALLEERFKLKLRSETKQSPVYELLAAKGGLKVKEAKCVGTPSPSNPCGAFSVSTRGLLVGRAVSMTEFAAVLGPMVSRSVFDNTGATGNYNFDLKWTPDKNNEPQGPGDADAPPTDPNGPSLYTALAEQLGLKLNTATRPLTMWVIESAERPSEN